MPLPVTGSIGKGEQLPKRYALHVHGPTYLLFDQISLYGASALLAGALGGFGRELKFATGFLPQPASQSGHPVSVELLIMALAPIWESNGASPEGWNAMKFVPQESACPAVHDVVVPPAVRGALLAMNDGWNSNVLAETAMPRASHWQPSQ